MSCMFLCLSYFVKFSKKSLVLSYVPCFVSFYSITLDPRVHVGGSGRVGFHSMTLDSRVQFPWDRLEGKI